MTTAAVYATFARDLERWFARRVPADRVDDRVQETFLRVHSALPELRETDRLAPWVYRVARSVLIDNARRERPAEPLDEDPVDETDFPEPDATGMVAAWLPAFVEGLPEPYREAVRLSELEGLSQREVAERLGLSASGARTRVQRGRAKLREQLLQCCHVAMEHGVVVDVKANDCSC